MSETIPVTQAQSAAKTALVRALQLNEEKIPHAAWDELCEEFERLLKVELLRLDRPPNLRRPGRTDPMTPNFGPGQDD